MTIPPQHTGCLAVVLALLLLQPGWAGAADKPVTNIQPGAPKVGPKVQTSAQKPTPPPPTALKPEKKDEPPEQRTLQAAPLEQPASSHPASAVEMEVIVPAHTVLNVTLDEELSTEDNNLGDEIKATVKTPLYLGPYLAIPEQAKLVGKVVEMNKKANDKGHNPYLIVKFTAMQRPGKTEQLPFNGTLMAYKAGLNGQEYLGRLPKPGDKKRRGLKSAIGGAISGAFINPIFGPLVGFGAGYLQSTVVNGIAKNGDVEIEPDEEIPIAVDKSFAVPISVSAPHPGETEAALKSAPHKAPELSPQSSVAPDELRRLIQNNEPPKPTMLDDKLH